MADDEIASALKRVQAVFERRPGSARHADSPAVARWHQGLRVSVAGAADDAALEALARDGCRCSPIARSLARANQVELHIEIPH